MTSKFIVWNTYDRTNVTKVGQRFVVISTTLIVWTPLMIGRNDPDAPPRLKCKKAKSPAPTITTTTIERAILTSVAAHSSQRLLAENRE
jgi:hypothetical protein